MHVRSEVRSSARRPATAARSRRPTPTSSASCGKDRRREDGGPLWHGPPRGTDLKPLAASRGTPLQPQAFGFSVDWLRYFITQDPQFDWTTVTPAAYQAFWDRSYEQYGIVIGTDNPDLSAFRDRGGKTIIWHGWADQLITAEGTIDYYTRVQQQMGGAKQTSDFARLFLAPGVAHCSGGPGRSPPASSTHWCRGSKRARRRTR